MLFVSDIYKKNEWGLNFENVSYDVVILPARSNDTFLAKTFITLS